MARLPPVDTTDRPAARVTLPPAPDVPLPMPMQMAPLHPAVAAAEPSRTEPLFPDRLIPVLNTNRPLTPDVPEFALSMVISPLLAEEPRALEMRVILPVAVEPVPPTNPARPPIPLVPLDIGVWGVEMNILWYFPVFHGQSKLDHTSDT